MDTATAHSNLYVGGIEGSSWSLSVGTSWANQSHTSSVSEFSNLNGKALTSLPSLVLHLQSTTKVKSTGDNKWVGFSRAYITLTYDTLYSQSAQGSTGVSASLSNSGTAVEGYYKSGTTTTYTATLSNGYGFAGWYTAATGGTLVSRSLTYSETCNSNRTLYARAFAVSAQGETGVTASSSRGSDGYTFTFTATLDSDKKYGFKGWYDNSSGTGTPVSTSLSYTAELSAATTLYAKVFTVAVATDGNTSPSFTRGSDGRTFSFTTTVNSGYAFDGWYNGATRLNRTLSFNATLSDSVTYSSLAFSVTYSGDSGASVTASRSSDCLSYTFTGSFIDTQTSKSTINKWSVNNVDQSTTSLTLEVSIDSNTSVSLSTYTSTIDSTGIDGISSCSISRTDNTTVSVSCNTSTGWDFEGWYSSGSKVSSLATYSFTPSSSATYSPLATHHIYSVDVYNDAHSTVTVNADNYYYGTTVTISVNVSDSAYKFKGWYEDSSYSTLYSSQSSLSVVIYDDITLYAKTVEKNKFYVKKNGQWVLVTAVYQKTNGVWELKDEPSYHTLFDVDKKYKQHDVLETFILITNDNKQFTTSDNKIFNVNH